MVRVILVFFLGVLPFSAVAKELTNRLGVGYMNHTSLGLPALAVRYHPNPLLGLSGSLGVDTSEAAPKFGFMVKVFKIHDESFKEDNLNFYMGSGLGLISEENSAGQSNTGFELTGFVGSEFFFTGLDNLGFNFETGIGVTSIDSQVRFRTLFEAGLVFYF